MAQYVTKDEFLDQGIPGEAFSGLSDSTINAALMWASSVADAHLRKRHTLPLLSWGDDLRAIVTDVASWRLLKRHGFNPASGSDAAVVKAYDDAINTLRDVAKGLVELEVVDSTSTLDEEGPLAGSSAEKTSFQFYTGTDDDC